jgi:hypothetical protein
MINTANVCTERRIEGVDISFTHLSIPTSLFPVDIWISGILLNNWMTSSILNPSVRDSSKCCGRFCVSFIWGTRLIFMKFRNCTARFADYSYLFSYFCMWMRCLFIFLFCCCILSINKPRYLVVTSHTTVSIRSFSLCAFADICVWRRYICWGNSLKWVWIPSQRTRHLKNVSLLMLWMVSLCCCRLHWYSVLISISSLVFYDLYSTYRRNNYTYYKNICIFHVDVWHRPLLDKHL